jgi:PAS domain S-box-containing protein
MSQVKILVVEDERIIAEDIRGSLSRMGYAVTAVVATGHDAVEKAGTTSPDLVLMDIMLEGAMDGVQAAEQIIHLYNIPVIFLTAFGDESTLQRAKQSGPFGYALKPFEEKELHTTIEISLHKHRLESRLKQSEQWLATTLQSIGDAVIATDAAGRIKLINPVAEALTGWRREQALGKTLSQMLKIVDEKTRAPIGSPIARAMRDGQTVSLNEPLVLIARNGTERVINDSAAPIKDEKGTITGGVMVFRDVTERRRTEAALLQAQKLESLGVLAGGIAHDFNNLLVGILGYAGLVLDQLPPHSPSRETVTKIKAAALRAAEMVQQLLTYVGSDPSPAEHVDLNLIVEEMANLVQLSISKNVAIKHDFAPALPVVEADPTQIRQVVMNLIINASEAIGEKNGAITISTGVVSAARAYLDDSFFGRGLPEGAYVYLDVSDTGKGMSEETRSKIFDPFYTSKSTGRGLGLAAVSGIVRSHRGAIHLRSTPGHGATFRVLLPSHTKAGTSRHREIQKPATTPSPYEKNAGNTVLVIDDDEVVRTVTVEILEQLGYSVSSAGDGREGVRLFRARASDIDCVLLDLSMPQPNGEKVFAEIRKIKTDARVILMSGYSEDEAVRRFSGIGLAGFLHKPYTNSELQEKLNQALEKS